MTSCHSLIVDMDEAEWSRRQNWLFCQGVKALRPDKARLNAHVNWPENIPLYKYNQFRTASFQQSDMVMPQRMVLQAAKRCPRQDESEASHTFTIFQRMRQMPIFRQPIRCYVHI